MALPWLNDQLAALKPKAIDDFSRTTITGAQHALADAANPLRLNFFSTAMRILFEHMMGTLAPIDQVVQTEWFVSEREGNAPTRGQRIVPRGSLQIPPGVVSQIPPPARQDMMIVSLTLFPGQGLQRPL
jgi:hypothetical protein